MLGQLSQAVTHYKFKYGCTGVGVFELVTVTCYTTYSTVQYHIHNKEKGENTYIHNKVHSTDKKYDTYVLISYVQYHIRIL